MAENGADYPYKTIGWHLKFAREQLKESLKDAAGAVEIDIDTLKRIEGGYERPSEDVLMLLIAHLGLDDAEATSLWELAGYTTFIESELTVKTPTQSDLKIIYTDMVHAVVNDYGVVMNFMQSAGYNNQLVGVARVGMSKEHAQKVLEVLQRALDQKPEAPKMLTGPKSNSKRINKKSM